MTLLSVPQSRWSKPGLAAMVLLTAGAIGGWIWYAQRDVALSPWQAARFLPADADAVAWTATLGDVADNLGALGKNVQGLQGVFEMVKLAVGVDLRDARATERAGLRRDAGLAASIWHNGLWMALPVANSAGVDHVLEVLRRRGYGIGAPQLAALQRSWLIADRQGGQGRARVWDLGDTAVVRVALDATATGNEISDVQAWLATPKRSDVALDGAVLRIAMAWGLDTPQAKRVREPLHKLLGPADLLVGGALDRVQGLDVRAELGGDGVRLRATLQAPSGKLADIAAYYQNFVGDDAALNVGDLLPDETPLLLRARVNPALLSMVPEALRNQVLPATALAVLHPSLSGVDAGSIINQWDGQVALAVLAIGDSVPLDPNAWKNLWWRTALRLGLAVSLRTDVAAKDTLEKLRSAIDTSADRSTPAQYGAWAGFGVPGPGAPWLLLRNGRHLAVVAGTGATDDLRRITDGKYASLDKVARPGLDRALVQGQGTWLGVRLATPRIVRSLRRRGVPDYASQLVGAIDTVAARVQLTNDAMVAELSLFSAGNAATAEMPVNGTGP